MVDESREVLAVITARGGSKGLPRKNVLPIAGRPLIGWTIAAARAAQCVARIIVSTDDEEIAAVARAEGAEVPFVRPAELATDRARSVDVLRHAIEQCPGYAFVVLLQPTSPLRTGTDIDAAFEQMKKAGAPSCVSICEVQESPWLMFKQQASGGLKRLLPDATADQRRQDMPNAFRLNGAVYLARTDWFLASGCLVGAETVGYRMSVSASVDIDNKEEFERAESLLMQRGHHS